jgi:hypothetical protein
VASRRTFIDERECKLASAEGLRGEPMIFKPYRQWSEDWNHDHCQACSATLCELDGPDYLHEGWATTEAYEMGAECAWLCAACFEELAGELELRIETQASTPANDNPLTPEASD